ncbi:MAG TPA: hypothetical protein VFQ72_02555 [Candidatus Paceibacterota bacterium]|nr:hypothetical protein [Candidatus Paceibacterota bacterium]
MSGELDQVLNLYKRRSETPLQTLERYASAHPAFKKVKMTYAGRLDPMAEGVLVALTGDKNKERDAYTGLDKDYEFEFVLGVETDTHDILGKIVKKNGEKTKNIQSQDREKEVAEALAKYVGTFMQKYPAYSSKVVDGKQLFDLARQGKIDSIVLPEHQVTVAKLELLGKRAISAADFKTYLHQSIEALTGDFRQAEILALWDAYIASAEAPRDFVVYRARVTCGSGFYVRQLVSDIGRDLGTGAVTVSILRTRVGALKVNDCWVG